MPQTAAIKRSRKAETKTTKPPPEPTKLVDMLDEILEEIDGVLEENAHEFVKNYVQKPGQ